ncbi:threonylcarbamoyl-AMP synthase [candidate division KSB1 bacterium]|nr:threonylcarbamoyl-AMP synthase [candidate division KSB1 bacterium]
MNILKIDPFKPEPHLLRKAAEVILNDGVIGYPTETVYGLGANAESDTAVEKVFRLKGRDQSKPILVIASNMRQILNMADTVPPEAETLAKRYWPGALTIIFRAKATVNKRLLGNGQSIGIRIPDNRICLKLIEICNRPLTSTSANETGGANPLSAAEVNDNFGNRLDLIIDGGIASSRIASTVLDLTDKNPVLRRAGRISKQDIEQTIKREIYESI